MGFILVSVMILAGIYISYTSLMPVLNDAKIVSRIELAKSQLLIIDNAISSLIDEGYKSSRSISVSNPENLLINNGSKSFYYKIKASGALGKFHEKDGNILVTSGGDVNCYDNGNYYIMENSHLKVEFYKYGSYTESDWVPINTSYLIHKMYQLETNSVVEPTTYTMLNQNSITSYGNGYSELIENGYKLPYCKIHFHINCARPYDIYFTLNKGVDFLVGNIKY